MKSVRKLMAVFAVVLCAVCMCIAPVYADTDGTEMQLMESSKLEIQLGTDWAGTEFQLKTDVGLYPDTIAVGVDGVLRLEIGGSSTYTLTSLSAGVVTPQIGEAVSTETTPDESQEAPATEQQEEIANTETSDMPDQTVTEPDAPVSDPDAEEQTAEEENTVAGIPVMHIVLFGGGLVLAIGGLIAIKVLNNRRERDDGYYDDDYEDE